jgi:formamidopyrimidine-DNA glycosylase
MPELPEVETVRRGLEPVLAGQRVARVDLNRKDLRFPLPERFAARLEGRLCTGLDRRAKYLLARFETDEVLVLHLGMTGRLTVASGPDPRRALGRYVHDAGEEPKHDHVRFHMAGGAVVTYNDARRFGFMLLVKHSELDEHPLLAGLGVEPLGNGLSATYLAERAKGRRCDLKSFLMDQRVVAGLGNIYVSEALHRAGLSPRRACRSLTTRVGAPTQQAQRLVAEIRNVLVAALDAGGSTLRDYRHADGELGSFQTALAVYDRAGQPCLRPACRGRVRRIVQAGRATFYCGACQR